jgi:enoyl-CoA hydratase
MSPKQGSRDSEIDDLPPLVRVERHGRRGELILNRPERRNALIGPMVLELRQGLAELDRDPEIGAILLRGAGGTLCAGLDLEAFSADPEPPWREHFSHNWLSLHVELFEASKPVVGALERYAIAGGSGLALACDLLVAGETSYMWVREAEFGMAAPMNVAWLQLRSGLALTNRLVMMADRVTGPELVDSGLALQSVADDQVLARAREVTDRLAGFPGAAHAPTKAMARTLLPGYRTAREYFEAVMEVSQFGTRSSTTLVLPKNAAESKQDSDG